MKQKFKEKERKKERKGGKKKGKKERAKRKKKETQHLRAELPIVTVTWRGSNYKERKTQPKVHPSALLSRD